MLTNKVIILIVFALAVVFNLQSVAHADGHSEILFEEDFESVTLGDSVEEGIKGVAVWSKEGPKGWVVKNDFTLKDPDVPLPDGLGIEEWTGWSFPQLEWWVQTAENQGRGNWKKAAGVVAVADPDEWDDEKIDGKSPDDVVKFNSILSTPTIDLKSIEANSVVLQFDSSFRMEKNQDFEIHVSFDGKAPIVLMSATSDDSDESVAAATFHDGSTEAFATSEDKVEFPMSIKVTNPEGAKSMVFSWAMLDADNDWWWALDNIVVTGEKSKVSTPVEANGKLATTWGAIRSFK